MVVRRLVILLLLGSALGAAESQTNCMQELSAGLSTHLPNCADRNDCEVAVSTILSSYQSCVGLGAVSLTSYTDFLQGVLKGFEKNPALPSSCITALTAPSSYWALMVSTLQLLFSSKGSLTNIFDVLTFFDQYLGEFISNVERCSLSTLQEHWNQLLTLEGVFKAMYVVGLNINQVAVIDT